MFERYTEKARRAIFFARYEASQFGCLYIEAEHLMLGVVREMKGRIPGLANPLDYEKIRADLERTPMAIDARARAERVSTSVDLPLNNECKRVLTYAAEEAEALHSQHIGIEHLMLGLLREQTEACAILQSQGLQLDQVRMAIQRLPVQTPGLGAVAGPSPAMQHAPARITFVDGDTQDEIESRALFAFFPVPRFGELVRLGSGADPFRVVRVTYDFSREGHPSVIVEVVRRQEKKSGAAPTDST